MMVGRQVNFKVDKKDAQPGEVVLDVRGLTVPSKLHKNNAVKNVSLQVRRGEIVCLAGIEGNGQTEFVYALTGLEKQSAGTIHLCGKDVSHAPIRQRSKDGMSHIPEDRHKHGLVLDFTLEQNMVLQRYWQPEFQKNGFINFPAVRQYSDRLIEQYDVRSGQGLGDRCAQHVRRQPAEGNRRARDRQGPRASGRGPADEVWTWVRLSTFTSSSSPSATPERACCWCLWSWTRS